MLHPLPLIYFLLPQNSLPLGYSSQFTLPRPLGRQHGAAPTSANTSFLFPLVYLPRDPLLWFPSVGPERGSLYLHHFCVFIVSSLFLVFKKFLFLHRICVFLSQYLRQLPLHRIFVYLVSILGYNKKA